MSAQPNSMRWPDLAAMQRRADPLADSTMACILGEWPGGLPSADAPQWQRIATVNRLFAQWTDNASLDEWQATGPGVDPEMALALRRYLDAAHTLPDWTERGKIEQAEQLFMRHGALSCILLFCASLPECYVILDLSSVLHTAGQLEQNTEYRIRSTAAMIFPVMMHGGLTHAQGAGVAQVLKVRLIHATIRNLILRGAPPDAGDHAQQRHSQTPASDTVPELPDLPGASTIYRAFFARGWNSGRDGLPCNQEQLAYTLLTFSYVFLRSMRRLGMRLSQADEEAYLHAWNVVGHVLGVEQSLMAHTMEQGKVLMDQMQARGRTQAVLPDPRPALTAALMHTMSKTLPWPVVRPFPQLMTRYLCGNATAKDLGLSQPVPWLSRMLFWTVLIAARLIDALVHKLFMRFSIVRTLTRVLGYYFMSHLLMDQTRPLNLPDQVLNQMDAVVDSWSTEPQTPNWLNRLEARLTTLQSWSRRGHASRHEGQSPH